MRVGLGGGNEAGAEHDSVGPQRERRDKAAPVSDAARGENGKPVNGVDDARNERHRRHRSRMPTRVRALRNDRIDTRGSGFCRLRGVLDSVHQQRPAGVTRLDPGSGIAPPRDKHVDTRVEDGQEPARQERPRARN